MGLTAPANSKKGAKVKAAIDFRRCLETFIQSDVQVKLITITPDYQV